MRPLPHLRALTGDRAIRAAFAGETDVDLAHALANGEAVCVYVDDSRYPMAFANVMTFIFRRFADIAQSRLSAKVTPPKNSSSNTVTINLALVQMYSWIRAWTQHSGQFMA